MEHRAPKGTADMLPDTARVWEFMQSTAQSLFARYGYQPIYTPTFEQTEVFVRSIGEATDIVSKEMYTFEDRGGRSITLRPEGTASVVRAALEHGLVTQGQYAKLYYAGPMFRYERPQAGRMRQFWQIGAEAQAVAAAIGEGVHLLRDDVGGLADRPLEHLGELEDRRRHLEIAGAFGGEPRGLGDAAVAPHLVGQKVVGAANRLQLRHGRSPWKHWLER